MDPYKTATCAMKIRTLLSLIIPSLALNLSHSVTYGQKLKNNKTYFTTPSKVGLYVKVSLQNSKTAGSGGLLGAVISSAGSSGKYDEPLRVLDPQLNPLGRFEEFYKATYSAKGKTVMTVRENLDSVELKEFEDPSAAGKKYYKKDLRFLKENLNIDEILIVFVEYGIRGIYSYGIETNRVGEATVQTQVINLSDNSYIMKESSRAYEDVAGKWNTPPGYESVKNSLQTAIRNVIIKERLKYQ